MTDADKLRELMAKAGSGSTYTPPAPSPGTKPEAAPPATEEAPPAEPVATETRASAEPVFDTTRSPDVQEAGIPGIQTGKFRVGVSSELQAAFNYKAQGFSPIPITRGAKQAAIRDWQKVAVEEHEFAQHWGGATPCGIAIPLGGRSKGLVDIDLDWPEARALADSLHTMYGSFVPFGRKSAPRSHRICFCPEALDVNTCKTVAFAIPGSIARKLNLSEAEHAANVLEVRGNGGYTIFPPTIHASGERIEWDDVLGRSVQTVGWDDVLWSAGLLAFLSFMMRFYPPVGMRNDFNLALGGALLRALREKYGEDEVLLCEHVDSMVTTVCRLAGDQGRGASWEKRAANTLAKIKASTQVTGLPKLLEIIGAPELDKTLRKWLGADADDRPVIHYDETDKTALFEATQQAMLANPSRKGRVYQRGGSLVHVFRTKQVDDKVGEATGTLGIKTVSKSRIGAFMTDSCRFKQHVMHPRPHWKYVGPSDEFRELFIRFHDDWQFDVLHGICEAPTLREDGTLLADEGYDRSTGLLLNFGGVVFPPVPDSPTKEEALAALAKLKHIFRGFPFYTEEDGTSPSLSACLAMVLTGMVRRMLPSAPLAIVGAPSAGTGKTLLVNTIAIICTGVKAAPTSLNKNDEENEKRIISELLKGPPFILLDNLSAPLGGDMLCTVLTESTFAPRVLGSNEKSSIPTNVTWLATGNQIAVKGDMTRRVIRIQMDSQLEHPEERRFDFDSSVEATVNRPELAMAALTVMRAFIQSHDRHQVLSKLTPFGSFNAWSDIVRAPLVWLGEADPCAMREAITAEDPVSTALGALLAAWAECEGLDVGTFYNAAQIAALANNAEGYAGFHQALRTCVRNINSFAPEQVARYLSGNVNRIIGGRRILKRVNQTTRIPEYSLDIVGAKKAEAPAEPKPAMLFT